MGDLRKHYYRSAAWEILGNTITGHMWVEILGNTITGHMWVEILGNTITGHMWVEILGNTITGHTHVSGDLRKHYYRSHVSGDLRKHYYKSHVSDLISWEYNDMINMVINFFSQTDCSSVRRFLLEEFGLKKNFTKDSTSININNCDPILFCNGKGLFSQILYPNSTVLTLK
jgi:hypothetical protein